MTMYTTSLPIRVSFNSNGAYSQEYSNYEISLGWWTPYVIPGQMEYDLLYTGKTYWDGNGKTSIEISRLLRNYQIDFKAEWDEQNQRFVPHLYNTDISLGINPTERSNSMKFGNAILKIEPDDIAPQYIYVSMMANPFYTDTNRKPYEIFDVSQNGYILQNYNRMYHCVNHIPFVKSDNSLLGWFFGVNKKLYESEYHVQFMSRTQNSAYVVAPSSCGTFYGAKRATDFYTILGVTGEDDIYLTTNVSQNPYIEENHIAHVDECPRDFYVNWWDSCGWHSLGFDGNVTVGKESDNSSITVPLGIDTVYATNSKCTFELNSGYVEPEVVSTIMSLKDAKAIFVNDTRNDKGQWCTLRSINGDRLNTKIQRQPQNVDVVLEEAIMLKS